ncbi:MAG: AI-2E family transporter [Bacteroidales bacterium]|nr:AI-2E family transporter [Bacteroidales bacterium]
MKEFGKYFLIVISLALVATIVWYFHSIVTYIIISAVLSLIGHPIVNFLDKIKIRKFKFPHALNATIALAILWALFFSFFRIFIPLVANEANDLSNINIDAVITNLEGPIQKAEQFYENLDIKKEDEAQFQIYIEEKLGNIVSFSLVTDFFSSIAGLLGDIFIAVFSITFITFFFLKDDKLFGNAMVILIPAKHEEAFRRAMASIKKLLMRYFIGICGQITGIIILATIGLTIVGVGFKHALVIGLFVGIINVIPYIGPLIGVVFGTIMGIATHLDLDFYTQLLPLAAYMVIVFLIVQVIDNVFFQPLIFGSSVKAHPLEIFLVIMIAGSLAGITGMVLAIPSYTIIRVLAKEFFNNFRVVKSLTKNI